jgi:glycosyltransferase involved in cell wall biosynthesis
MEAKLLKRAGFNVTVITSGVHYMTGEDTRPSKGWCTEEWRDEIRILKTWAPSGHRHRAWKRLMNYLSYTLLSGLAGLLLVKKVNRVLAGTDPLVMMPMVFMLSLIKRAPMVLDERDLFPETAIALGVIRDGILSRFLFQMQQFFRKKSIGLLAATPGIRAQLIAYGCSEDKVHLLYNADVFLIEDLRNTNVSFRSLKQEFNKQFLLGYSGGLGLANDIFTLLRSMRYLQDVEELGVVIIGTGEKLQDYKEYTIRNGMANVFFTGAIPRGEVRPLLLQIDVCVHLYPDNNLFHGALASKIFDYLALGKPIIFCGRGDTANLLDLTQSGIVLEPENSQELAAAILKLYKDQSLRVQMGQAARTWYENTIKVDAGCSTIRKAMSCDNRGKICFS